MKPVEQIKLPIKNEMELFEEKFKESMLTKVPLLNRITYYIVRRKGKQMRPMFVFLVAKMVSDGSWKDYGLSISSRQISFSVFKNAAENALYKICKNFKPNNKNLKYLITDYNGKILKNSFDLKSLLRNTNWKKLKK